jgi:hypothetical protein
MPAGDSFAKLQYELSSASEKIVPAVRFRI